MHLRMLRGPLAAGIHADEMRREQYGGLALHRLEVFHTLDMDQVQDVRPARPPQDAALDQAASEHLEVVAQKFLSCLIAQLRQIQFQIDGAYPAAFGSDQV
jgi:hypothetical protein